MELMKKHRMHILLPVILVVLSLVGSLIYTGLQAGGSASSHVSLGQQYLNNLDYSAAILEFSNAISLDPTNKDARIGLAEAYSQTGNYDFAAEVLEEVIDEEALDPEITQQLIQVYEDGGKHGAAIQLIIDLIAQPDEDAYYEQLQEALEALYSLPRTYAQGTDQALLLNAGGVSSRGSNTLGQLGTDRNLGSRDQVQNDYASAEFTGNALAVYCAGRTSYVIDENHDLWAAGENRWGQMGLSYGTVLPESGWIRLTDTGDVAAVAGGSGTLLVLKTDGSLWTSGGSSTQTLTRSTEFGTVIRIFTSENYSYVLNGDGKLYYQCSTDSEAVWYKVSSDVIDFTAWGSSVYWLNSSGNLCSYYGFSHPEDWTWMEDGSVKPSISICAMAFNGSSLIFQSMDGGLYRLDGSGSLTQIQTDSPVANVYAEAGNAVVVLEDGSILLWENYADDPVTL